MDDEKTSGLPQEEVANTLPQEEGDVFQMFDKADEEQIEQELKGAVAEEMVYSFQAGGKQVEGLSKAGTIEAMRAYNATALKQKKPYIVLDAKTKEKSIINGTVYVDIAAYLVDFESKAHLEEWVGSASASETLSGRSGNYNDPFAPAKAMSKAQRNAVRGLLPNDLVKRLIEKWSKQHKVRKFMSTPSPENLPEMECSNCHKPLSLKAREYYAKNPTKEKLCYECNQKKRQNT